MFPTFALPLSFCLWRLFFSFRLRRFCTWASGSAGAPLFQKTNFLEWAEQTWDEEQPERWGEPRNQTEPQRHLRLRCKNFGGENRTGKGTDTIVSHAFTQKKKSLHRQNESLHRESKALNFLGSNWGDKIVKSCSRKTFSSGKIEQEKEGADTILSHASRKVRKGRHKQNSVWETEARREKKVPCAPLQSRNFVPPLLFWIFPIRRFLTERTF